MNTLDGGELWRMDQPYAVNLSPDEAKSGAAGQSVIYTLGITNTGSMTGTYSLAAGGHLWPTTVSTSSITLAPGAGDLFSVTVAIPDSALGNAADTVTITAISQEDPSKSDTALLTTSVIPIFGLDLSPGDTAAGLPGATVTYTLTISNSGNTTDTFTLAKSGAAWPTNLSTPNITLASGASGHFMVAVSIPTGSLATANDLATITATSQGDNNQVDTANLTTTVTALYGVKLSAGDSLSGPAGGTITYTLWLTNSGNVTDTFDLSATGNLWPANLSTTAVTLSPHANSFFKVSVSIPITAADLVTDTVTIEAISRGDAGQKDSAMLLTTSVLAPVYGVNLSPDQGNAGLPGAVLTYSLTITNTGDVADTFSLVASGHSWTTTLSDSSVTLAAGASAALTVTVNIPPGALGNDHDAVTVTATSQGDNGASASATLTTSVTVVYGVELPAGDSLSGQAGATLTYTLWLTNSGNVSDTFDLGVSGNGWTTTLSTAVVTLAAGQSQAVTIWVIIPAGAAALDSDVVTITAVSRGDGAKSDVAALTTMVSGRPYKLFLPLILKG